MITNSFGQITSQSNPSAQPYNGFGGGHIDADTGDITNLERRYDPTTGGWTTKDPLGFGGGDANTDRYSGNSPTNTIDPTGLAPNAANMMDAAVTAAMMVFYAPTILAQVQMAEHHQQAMQTALQHMIDMFQATVPNMIGMQQAMFAQQAAIIGAAANAPIGPPNWVDAALAGTSNFANGFANTITLGGVGRLNAALGNDAFVNTDSGLYTAGEVAGYVWWSLAIPQIWSAAGGPTWGFNVGPGTGATGSHVSFFTTPWGGGAPTTATGALGGVYTVPAGWYQTWFTVSKVPILFPNAALNNPSSWNCVTAAAHSLVTGWLPFL